MNGSPAAASSARELDHPEQLRAFLDDLPARLANAAHELERSEMLEVTDRLSDAIDEVQEAGYELDPTAADAGPETAEDCSSPGIDLLTAAAIELARWVAGLPEEAWNVHPELAGAVRAACGAAQQLLEGAESGDD